MNLPIYFPNTASIGKNGQLKIADYNLQELVERFGSPLYVIDEQTMRETMREYKAALAEYYPKSMPIYASKANCLQALLAIVSEEGFGLDVVSDGELYTAQSIRFPGEKIYLHGNNKSSVELKSVIEYGGRPIIDNFHELNLLQELDLECEILLRVTPGVECHTHEYIQTGQNDSKFGFDLSELDQALEILQKDSKITVLGLHAHIGSQIFETEPFLESARILLDLYKNIKDKYNLEFSHLDLGGGFGMHYTEQDDPPKISEIIQALSNVILSKCKEYSLELPFLIIEPGRSVIARAGVTLYTIGATKQIPGGKYYVSADGGMADNPRTITYGAEYRACLTRDPLGQSPQKRMTLAGRYCESGDIIIKSLELAENVKSGDLIAVFGTGAYNYSMSSNYNRVPKPAMVLLNNGEAEIIMQRETLDDLIRNDILPPRFDQPLRGVN